MDDMKPRKREKRIVPSGKGVYKTDKIEDQAPASNDEQRGRAAKLSAEYRKALQEMGAHAKRRYDAIQNAKSSPENYAKQKKKNDDIERWMRNEVSYSRVINEVPDFESMEEVMQDYLPIDDELAGAYRRERIRQAYRKKNSK